MDKTTTAETNSAGTTTSILIPLPDYDFDPTECAIPWKVCTSRGWHVTFSTEHGDVARADPNLLRGPILGPLGAGAKARAAYRQMTEDPGYQHPVPYAEIDPYGVQAILLPGGHGPGMRQYLESPVLQDKVRQFWQQGKLIGAICHGTLVLARTIDPQTGRSVLFGHKLTALPRSLDWAGCLLSRVLRRDYITCSCYVAEEVSACLERSDDLSTGSNVLVPYVVSDRNLITARSSLDARLFAERFAEALGERSPVVAPVAVGVPG